MSIDLSALLKSHATTIDEQLGAIDALGDLAALHEQPSMQRLGGAMAHGLLAGGKRLRPFLVLEAALLGGVPKETAMPAALAMEMVHTYSLIHDDLPAMDDADTRRGKPSVHKAYDEAIAILAGDGLLTDAFSVIASGGYAPPVAIGLVRLLANAAGSQGMVGGQMMDLYPGTLTEAEIIAIQERKTGALIIASAEMGGLIAGLSAEEMGRLRTYASALGLAFQIVDDILDVTQSAETLGKPAGADSDAGKATFVSLLGLDGARARVSSLTDQAKDALAPFADKADRLMALADDLAARQR